ncbi:OmpW family protein [Endozoicomonas sp. G2_2]|uniref:OmpW/AlkL family protein n=1 Tax=Endozoicomonas sp. G2_2 TaxID=2821092 RepID=UPI001ADBC350|nr:OmpW family protein [Endozoicomonas sp. G2_2]MBO9468647.1 OmpW family protein [Endozoicomonas sp. G2_2]
MPRYGNERAGYVRAMSIGLALVLIAGFAPAQAAEETARDDVPDTGEPIESPGFYDRYIKDRLYLKPGVSYLDFGRLESTDLKLSGVKFPATLAIQNGGIEGAKASISNQYIGTIALGYNIPGTGRHLSFETIIGKPIDINFVAQPGTLRDESLAPTARLGNVVPEGIIGGEALQDLLNDLGGAVNDATGLLDTGIPPLGSELGSVKSLPIMMTLLYHPFPDSYFRPYIGGGAVYLYNYDSEITNDVLTQVNDPGFDVSSTPGYVLQAGIDIGNPEQGFFGFADVRYIGDATVKGELSDVNVRVRNPALGTTLDALGYGEDIAVGDADIELDINPIIYTVGVGYRF